MLFLFLILFEEGDEVRQTLLRRLCNILDAINIFERAPEADAVFDADCLQLPDRRVANLPAWHIDDAEE